MNCRVSWTHFLTPWTAADVERPWSTKLVSWINYDLLPSFELHVSRAVILTVHRFNSVGSFTDLKLCVFTLGNVTGRKGIKLVVSGACTPGTFRSVENVRWWVAGAASLLPSVNTLSLAELSPWTYIIFSDWQARCRSAPQVPTCRTYCRNVSIGTSCIFTPRSTVPCLLRFVTSCLLCVLCCLFIDIFITTWNGYRGWMNIEFEKMRK